MAVDYIKFKSGALNSTLWGTGTLELPQSGSVAYPDATKIGEPLWAKSSKILYIRDESGELKSPLPDIVKTADASTEIPLDTAANLSTYCILVQDPSSGVHKKVQISSFGAGGGLVTDKFVSVNASGAAGYLNDKLDVAAPLTKTTAGDDSKITIGVPTAGSSQLGVVKGGGNIAISGAGDLNASIATAGATAGAATTGLASFSSLDFTVAAVTGHVTLNAGKFLELSPADSATQTVAGKIIAIAPSGVYNTDNNVLVTKAFMLDTVASWGNKFDFKDAVVVAANVNVDITTLANGSTIDTVLVATGDRVLLAAQTTTTENGIYIVGASGGTTVRAGDYLPAAVDAAALIGSVIPVVRGGAGKGLWMTMSVVAGTAVIQPTSNDVNVTSNASTVTVTGGTGLDQSLNLDVNYGPSLGMIGVGTAGSKLNLRLKSGQVGLAADDNGVYLTGIDGGTW